MTLLTQPMRRALRLVDELTAHTDTQACIGADRSQNRLQRVTLHDAQATGEAIRELDRQTTELAGQLERDLVACHHLLAGQPSCPSCTRLARDADDIHQELGELT